MAKKKRKPRIRLRYPKKTGSVQENIADYDNAVTQWLDNGRVGDRPERHSAPKRRREVA